MALFYTVPVLLSVLKQRKNDSLVIAISVPRFVLNVLSLYGKIKYLTCLQNGVGSRRETTEPSSPFHHLKGRKVVESIPITPLDAKHSLTSRPQPASQPA